MMKLTKRDMFTRILNNYDLADDEISFINHELELLEEKNSAKSDSLTPTQKENEGYKDHILSVMGKDTLYTITDIMKLSDTLSNLSNQRVSAIVRQLKVEGKVERVEDKRKAYFKKLV